MMLGEKGLIQTAKIYHEIAVEFNPYAGLNKDEKLMIVNEAYAMAHTKGNIFYDILRARRCFSVKYAYFISVYTSFYGRNNIIGHYTSKACPKYKVDIILQDSGYSLYIVCKYSDKYLALRKMED